MWKKAENVEKGIKKCGNEYNKCGNGQKKLGNGQKKQWKWAGKCGNGQKNVEMGRKNMETAEKIEETDRKMWNWT